MELMLPNFEFQLRETSSHIRRVGRPCTTYLVVLLGFRFDHGHRNLKKVSND